MNIKNQVSLVLIIMFLYTNCSLNNNDSNYSEPTSTITASPESTATPAPDFSSLQNFVDDFIVEDMALIIGDGNGILYSYEKGNFTVNTKIRIASANKWLTGATVWSLIDQGTLHRNDNPHNYIDYWTDEVTDFRSTITFDDLLGMTSGFNNSPTEPEDIGSKDYTLYECVEILYNGGLDTNPGTALYYGPEHFQMAALMASQAQGGKDFRQIMRDEIFNTAGMSSATSYGADTNDNARYSGGIFSTAADYGLFLKALLAGVLFDDINGFLEDRTANIPLERVPNGIIENELDWHYAFGFWKECDLPSYDSSCDINPIVSSPGAFGFTPWIDFGRRYWGVIAFEKFTPSDFILGAESVKLEQKIQETVEGILELQ